MAFGEPRGSKVRKAITQVSDAIREDPRQPIGPLVSEAILRFDLDPKQARYLHEFFRREKPTTPGGRPPSSD